MPQSHRSPHPHALPKPVRAAGPGQTASSSTIGGHVGSWVSDTPSTDTDPGAALSQAMGDPPGLGDTSSDSTNTSTAAPPGATQSSSSPQSGDSAPGGLDLGTGDENWGGDSSSAPAGSATSTGQTSSAASAPAASASSPSAATSSASSGDDGDGDGSGGYGGGDGGD